MSDVAKWHVHGPVRTVSSEIAEWDLDRNAWKPARMFNSAVFRADGKLDETRHHNPDGSIVRMRYLYDAAGRLAEQQSFFNDKLRMRMIYTYDDSGRHLRTSTVDESGKSRDSDITTYDAAGRKTTLRFLRPELSGAATLYGVEGTGQAYGAPGAATMTIIHDASDRPLETLFHNARHELLRRIIFTRDEAGRLLAEEVRLIDPVPFPEMQKELEAASPEDRARLVALLENLFSPARSFAKTSYSYDPRGRISERVARMGALSEERTSYQYDDHDNPIQETTDHHNRDMGADEHGNPHLLSERSYINHTSFEYQYDPQGNWTERVISSRLEPKTEFQRTNMERRSITYYPV